MYVQPRNGSDAHVFRRVNGKAVHVTHPHHETPHSNNKEQSPDLNTDLDSKGIMLIEK